MELTDRLARLTDRQRECLRLVRAGFEIKDIARRLGLSIDTVDYHLRNARQTLGVNRSATAARLLAEQEIPPPGPPVAAPSVVDAPAPMPVTPATEGVEPAVILRDSQVARPALDDWLKPPLPTLGRPDNDLTWRGKLFWGLTIALILVGLVGGLKSLMT